MLIAGLDYWFKKAAQDGSLVDCENKGEFDVFEPRISRMINVGKFRRPPDHRSVRQGDRNPPPNVNLHVPAFRFPTWYRHTKTAKLKKFELHNVELPAHKVGAGSQFVLLQSARQDTSRIFLGKSGPAVLALIPRGLSW